MAAGGVRCPGHARRAGHVTVALDARRAGAVESAPLPPRLPALTSLRFGAALMVMLAHSAGRFGFAADADRQPLQIALGTAVSLFFVLSGLVLAFNYADLRTRAGVRAYYRARFARIWPVHATVLAAILLVDPTVPRPWVDATHLSWLPAHLLLVHSWITLDVDGLSAFNAITWTLSTECFFYVVFPFLIRPVRERPWLSLAAAIGLGLAAACAAQAMYRAGMTSVHMNPAVLEKVHPIGRLCEFVMGMVTGLLLLRRGHARPAGGLRAVALQVATVVAVAALAAELFRLPAALGAPVMVGDWLRNVGLAPAFAVMLFVLATTRGPFTRFLSLPLAERLGDLSYAAYMIHIVVLRQPIWFLVSDRVRPGPLGFALFVATTTGIAWLLFTYVEIPARASIRGRQATVRTRIA